VVLVVVAVVVDELDGVQVVVVANQVKHQYD
jgi:hypothetical protein